jgi:hypothetical protein
MPETTDELLNELYNKARIAGPAAEIGTSERVRAIHEELINRKMTDQQRHRLETITDTYPIAFTTLGV